MFDSLRSLFGGSSQGGSETKGATHPSEDGVDVQQYDHYTEAIDDIKQLKRDRDHEAAEELLLWCIVQTESEAENAQYNGTVAPAYYRHLAIVYRKDDRYEDEVEILERYVEVCREHSNEPDEDLVERLEKARSLAADQ